MVAVVLLKVVLISFSKMHLNLQLSNTRHSLSNNRKSSSFFISYLFIFNRSIFSFCCVLLHPAMLLKLTATLHSSRLQGPQPHPPIPPHLVTLSNPTQIHTLMQSRSYQSFQGSGYVHQRVPMKSSS